MFAGSFQGDDADRAARHLRPLRDRLRRRARALGGAGGPSAAILLSVKFGGGRRGGARASCSTSRRAPGSAPCNSTCRSGEPRASASAGRAPGAGKTRPAGAAGPRPPRPGARAALRRRALALHRATGRDLLPQLRRCGDPIQEALLFPHLSAWQTPRIRWAAAPRPTVATRAIELLGRFGIARPCGCPAGHARRAGGAAPRAGPRASCAGPRAAAGRAAVGARRPHPRRPPRASRPRSCGKAAARRCS